jgi:glycyl-tRNA synthetase (class II)
VDDKKTGERFRADKLIEDRIEAQRANRSDEEILSYYKETYQVNNLTPDSRPLEQQHALLVGEKIKNPNTKKEADRTDVRTFSLMLSTQL